MTGKYDWITDEMFDNKLEEIVGRMSTSELLGTPGVHEALREELNNDILDELQSEREEQ